MKASNQLLCALRFLSSLYRDHLTIIVKIVLLLLAMMGFNMLLPQIAADIIDKGLTVNNLEIVVYKAVIFFAVNIIIHFLYILIERFRLIGFNEIQTDLKEKTIRKLFQIKINTFNSVSSTELYQQLENDINVISGCFSAEILLALIQVFIIFGLVPVLLSISWQLCVLMLIAIPVKFLKSFYFAKRGYAKAKRMIDSKRDYSSFMSDIITGMETIRFYGLYSRFFFLFHQKQKRITDSQFQHELFQEYNIQCEAVIANAVTACAYIMAGVLIINNDLTIGQFIAFQTYSLTILGFVGQLFNIGYSISVLLPSIERFLDFQSESVEDEGGGGVLMKEKAVSFSFHNVKFSYPEVSEPPVLDCINLKIPYKCHFAILGNNGSGKTTLINLLLRLYEPSEGEIRINGVNINEYDIKSYREIFAVASQRPFLFCDTIKNNICLYKTYSEDQLSRAIEFSGLSNLVREKTLDYCVGQDGCELSGGQRQRISLARTLLHWTPVVILDETEANIDDEYEEILRRLMDVCYHDRTVIAITHRKELLKYMDSSFTLGGSQE